jgi:hypothetical protein
VTQASLSFRDSPQSCDLSATFKFQVTYDPTELVLVTSKCLSTYNVYFSPLLFYSEILRLQSADGETRRSFCVQLNNDHECGTIHNSKSFARHFIPFNSISRVVFRSLRASPGILIKSKLLFVASEGFFAVLRSFPAAKHPNRHTNGKLKSVVTRDAVPSPHIFST